MTRSKHFILIFGAIFAILCVIIATYFIIHNNTNNATTPINTAFTDLAPSHREKTCTLDHFKGKIWLYRVNTPKRLQRYWNSYAGFEMDIIFDSLLNRFNIDPKNKTGNFSLEDMFASLPDKQEKYFWLDFKNLGFKNKKAAHARLMELTEKYNINPARIVVESSKPTSLDLFTKSGFETSFYFPVLSSADSLEVNRGKIRKAIFDFDSSDAKYVSADFAYTDYLVAFFPNACHLMWYTDFDNKDQINNYILEKTNAQVILNADTAFDI